MLPMAPMKLCSSPTKLIIKFLFITCVRSLSCKAIGKMRACRCADIRMGSGENYGLRLRLESV